jgi:histidinol dehydrogenase
LAVLVTDSEDLARAVEREFDALLGRLDRAEVIAAAHACIVVVDSIGRAMDVANDFGPEHLELVVEDAQRWVAAVHSAGAVFVGPYSAVSLGDYVIGTNHTLPTAGSARFGSPLGVHTFLKRMSVAKLERDDLRELQAAARALARLEGLTAHAHAVEVRLDD